MICVACKGAKYGKMWFFERIVLMFYTGKTLEEEPYKKIVVGLKG